MSSDTLCRICIEKSHNLREMCNIFDGEEPIFKLIMRCTSVQISKDDGLPGQICHVCLANLKLVLRFKSQCESSDLYLRELQQNPEEDNDADKDCEEIQLKRKNMGIYQCPVCPYGTKSNYFMTDHMKRHDSGLEFFNCEDKLEKYECRKCNFVTDFVMALNEHNKDIHDTPLNTQNNRTQNRKYIMKSCICGECKFETRSELQWIRHTQSQCRGDKTKDLCWFECSMCPYKTKTAQNLKKHKYRQHNKPRSSSPRHKCDKCEYKTNYKSHMQGHKIRHHLAKEDIQWHKCDKCEYQGKTKDCIYMHYRLHHDSSKWLKCNKCEFTAKITNRLKQHVLLKHTPHHELEWIKCAHCVYRTKYKRNLVKHSNKRHPEKCEENEPEKYDCKECSFVADSTVTLNEHNTNVHNIQSDKQDTNRKSTAANDVNLQNHTVKNHLTLEEIQWHKCNICDYQGKTKNALDKHHRVNHDERKWVKCGKCEFVAKTKDSLKRHMLAKHTPHDEIQWFECGHCEYKAKFKATLVQHLMKNH